MRCFLFVVLLAAGGAASLQAQDQSAEIEMQKLLRSLPEEFDEFAHLHPLPRPRHLPKVRASERDEDEVCLDEIPESRDWKSYDDYRKALVGTIVVCAVAEGIERKLDSRKR